MPDNEVTSEIEARRRESDDEIFGAEKLFETPPPTLAGARAIIEYLITWDTDCDPEDSFNYPTTLLRSPIFAAEEART